ncbi:MAG: BON domain-containing protein [Thermoguttaceae bacterium]
MRRLSFVLTVAAAVLVLPTLAMASNQEVAEQVATNLRQSGQLQGYKVGVKFQEGTAWLRGRVASHEQMNAALRVAFQTEGVERVVNNLTVDPTLQTASASEETAPKRTKLNVSGLLASPLRQVNGATEPERRTQASYQAGSAGMLGNKTAQKLQEASPVASTFETMPVMPVAAESKPRPIAAPALQAAPAQIAQPYQAQPIGQPMPVGYAQNEAAVPQQQYVTPVGAGAVPAQYDQPALPNYAWPSYAAYPNYAAVTYPKQYSPMCWPYMGPFHPYPQVPLGWRKVTLEWHDGWWNLDFDDGTARGPFSGLFRPHKPSCW